MNRIKNMSRGGWIVVGFAVALLVVPSSVAVAMTLKYTGIEGTSLNKADVVPGGQLLTTESGPSESFASLNTSSDKQPPNANTSGTTCVPFGSMNLGASQAALITSAQVNVDTADASGGVRLFDNNNCGGSAIVNMRAPTIGETVIPFSTPITTYGPDGYSQGGNGTYLSVEAFGSATANVIVDGYATQ